MHTDLANGRPIRRSRCLMQVHGTYKWGRASAGTDGRARGLLGGGSFFFATLVYIIYTLVKKLLPLKLDAFLV